MYVPSPEESTKMCMRYHLKKAKQGKLVEQGTPYLSHNSPDTEQFMIITTEQVHNI